MAAPQASSRLKMLQARFQQKQLQEKEQKLLQLYDQQQLRAYQVVQRGSAGSNASSHSSTISQHTISKTASSSSHTTSTSQGGKVRQMFDERRQTSVKGIDRSYPLEPLENKPRKQANGNAVVGPRNGNLTVNRQSVTVKRVTRSDVNSNVNDGKPIHSYHEEITRENYGPPLRHEDKDEFSNENHVGRYSNGNHRLDGNKEVEIEEFLDEDTIQRNRMMAKIHLMNYDETLKHRVRNDLESEEFPEELMVDVPDKLPKRTATKKLTQAEARLERFKNANAKRSNVAKNTSTTLPATKKRSEPMFPAKSTSRETKVKKREVADRRLNSTEKNRLNAEVHKGISDGFEGTLSSLDSQRIDTWKESRDGGVFEEPVRSEGWRVKKGMESQSAGTSTEAGKNIKSTGDSQEFHCREYQKTTRAMKIDSVPPRTSSPKITKETKRVSDSPEFFRRRSQNCSTPVKIDSVSLRTSSPETITYKKRLSDNSEFFSKGSNKSATMNINLKNTKSRSLNTSKEMSKKHHENSRFYSQKYERSTTPDIKSKISNRERLSPESTRSSKSISPQYFAQSEKSATTIMVTPETITKFKTTPTPDKRRKQQTSPIMNRSVENLVNSGAKRKDSLEYPRRNIEARNLVSEFFARESERFVENRSTKSPKVQRSQVIISRSSSRNGSPVSLKDIGNECLRSRSPQYDNRKSQTSNKTMQDEKKNESLKRSQEIKEDKSSSPEFFCYEKEKSATTVSLKPKPNENLRGRSASPRIRSPEYYHSKSTKSVDARKSQKLIDIESSSPEFFCYETDKSATTVSLKPKPSKDLTDRSASPKGRSPEYYHKKSTTAEKSQKLTDIESSSPEFFCYETDKSATTVSLKPKPDKDLANRPISPKGRSPEYYHTKSTTGRKSQKLTDIESSSPEFFCYETDKSATTVSLKPKLDKPDKTLHRSTSPELYHTKSTTAKKSQKLTDIESSSPEFFCYETDKSATTVSLKPKPDKDLINRPKSPKGRSPEYYHTKSTTANKSKKLTDIESSSPEFFCYETEKSATTVSLKPKPDKPDKTLHRSTSPELYHRKSTKSPTPIELQKRSETSKKSEKLTSSKSSSPEFFCYETDKSATTVSLQPTPDKNLTNRPANLRNRSPEYYHTKSTTSATARKSQKLTDKGSSSPEFFCYETDKFATTVSLEPKPNKDSPNLSTTPRSESPKINQKRYPKNTIDQSKSPPHGQHKLPSQSLSKPYKKDSVLPQKLRTISKTPERPSSPKNTKPTSHSGSSGVLRSIKLIREAIKHQSIPKTKPLIKPHTKSSRDHIVKPEPQNFKTLSQSPKNEIETFDVGDKKGTKTPTEKPYDLQTPQSSPKSSTSVEVDTETQEIIMPHEYVEKDVNQGAERSPKTNLRGTYTRSKPSRESRNSIKSTNSGLFTYSARKPCKNRASLLEPNIFVESNAGKEERSGTTELNVDNETRARKCEQRDVSLKEIMSKKADNSSKKTNLQSLKKQTERTANRTTETKKEISVERKEAPSPSRIRVIENQKSQKKMIHTSTVRKDSLKGSPTRSSILRNLKKDRDTSENLKSMELVQKAIKERKSPTEKDAQKIRTNLCCRSVSDKCKTDQNCEERIARKRSKAIDDNEEVAPVKMNKPIDSSDESVKGELRENFPVTSMSNGILDKSSHEMSKLSEAKFTIVNAENEESRKDYGRTDSVESALRRFDSIGMEYGPVSLDNIVELNRESPGDHPHSQTTENRQTSRESDDTKEQSHDSETSLRRISDEQTLQWNLEATPRKTGSRENQKNVSKIVDTPCRTDKMSPKARKTSRERRTEKRFAKARDSMEIVRNSAVMKSPACKRRLFLDTDSNDAEHLKTKCSLKSTKKNTIDVKSRRSDKDEKKGYKMKSVEPKRSTSKEEKKELVNDVKSTGATDQDGSPLVKQLRSIEDIRKSFEKETFRQIGVPCLTTGQRSVSNFPTVDKISRSLETKRTRKSRLSDNVEDKRGRTSSLRTNVEKFESRKERNPTGSRLKVKGSCENKKVPASAESRLKVETSTRSRFQIDSSESRTLETSTQMQFKVEECSMSKKEQAAGRLIVNEDNPESGKQSALKRSRGISSESSCEKSADRCFKLTTGFNRIAKSPSPDPGTGKTEVNGRARRSIPTSPTKSPDTVARRPSAELRTQNTKSTKRSVPTRSTEAIGNRKTTVSTTARKSTDVVDGAILENGLHLRDQAGETKYDNNDSSTTRKGDAFVIEFDEQPRENEGIESRKPLLRRQSVEKQTSPTQSGRPPSSISTASSGSSTQSQTSGSKVRMASRAKTPCGPSPTKSTSAKGGASNCTVDNLVPCKICGRRFAQERVSLHEQICSKSVQKKRKQFDTMMYRVRGTDLEPFVKKGASKKQTESKQKKPEVKSNWRRKHEDFINAIRSAKQVQAHLAAGGKLSDLPPPPVSDTSDYIQCPHCGRKFNKAAAERHIPKCEHMLHNKPMHSKTPKPKR